MEIFRISLILKVRSRHPPIFSFVIMFEQNCSSHCLCMGRPTSALCCRICSKSWHSPRSLDLDVRRVFAALVKLPPCALCAAGSAEVAAWMLSGPVRPRPAVSRVLSGNDPIGQPAAPLALGSGSVAGERLRGPVFSARLSDPEVRTHV